MDRKWIAVGALLGALAVACGAFGAHALKTRLGAEDLDIWKTAVLYQALHAIALVVFGVFGERSGVRGIAGWCFFLGVLFFSGSLYALALGGPRYLGAVTPFGGVLFIAGWIDFGRQALRARV